MEGRGEGGGQRGGLVLGKTFFPNLCSPLHSRFSDDTKDRCVAD